MITYHINYIIIKFMHIFSTKAFYWKHRLRFTAKVKNDNIWKRTEEKEKTEGKIEKKKEKREKNVDKLQVISVKPFHKPSRI